MASSVDRSFCASRCSERGVCYSAAGDYFCVCYDVAADPSDCSPVTTTTIPSACKETNSFWLLWMVLVLVGAALFALLYVVAWRAVRYWRRHRFAIVRVDEEECSRAVPKAPPLEPEEVAVD
ncbi:hypothetical protein Y032_0049g1758 [Ancylostoma ceylanicum]|uniref:EGF-like domain-containing protein n=1 Tax=Ancylostoma ceylanicum TaxID=53326 RepID=A0A016U8W9_9BILA|nr:hypothetical protein Y032_0049g1758 [Ancylostoma ceylanicum]